jgi:glycosyltransferase involved in cell wall biosynthesis
MAASADRIKYLLDNEEESEQSIPAFSSETSQGFSITIIIPVHNEEKRLLPTVQRIIEYCISKRWDYEVVIVEDGSTDGTVNVIHDLISKDNRIKLISNKERLGKGRAIKHGVITAEKKYVSYMDADLSADPSELERLLLFIDEFDLVVGSRILRGKLPPINRPFTRSFLSHCYSKFFRTMFRTVPVYDPQCGLKLFKSRAAHILMSQTETNGFAFDCEVLVKASRLGLTVKEVPIIWKHRYGSKVSLLHEITIMARDLLSVWYKDKVSKTNTYNDKDLIAGFKSLRQGHLRKNYCLKNY